MTKLNLNFAALLGIHPFRQQLHRDSVENLILTIKFVKVEAVIFSPSSQEKQANPVDILISVQGCCRILMKRETVFSRGMAVIICVSHLRRVMGAGESAFYECLRLWVFTGKTNVSLRLRGYHWK